MELDRLGGGMAAADVYADRIHRYGAPARVLYDALTVGVDRWVPDSLVGREVIPTVVECWCPTWVVWSSLWPVSPDDVVEFAILRDEIHWTWRSPSPPDERGIGITRQRLNRRFGDNLRGYLLEDVAWESDPYWAAHARGGS